MTQATYFVCDDGTRIAYEDVGSGPAVVLLHGGYVSRREWEPQRQELGRAGYRAIFVDLRGHGESDISRRGYAVELLARDCAALMRALGLKDVVLVGHSLGGMVAQHLAREEQASVRGVILVDTAYATTGTLWESAQTFASRATFRLLPIKAIAKLSALQLGAWRPDVGPFIQQEMMQFAGDRARFLAILAAAFDFDSSAWLSELACPTLLIVAEHNESTRRQAARMLDWLEAGELEIISRAGHMLHWDDPIAFNASMLRFLRRVMA